MVETALIEFVAPSDTAVAITFEPARVSDVGSGEPVIAAFFIRVPSAHWPAGNAGQMFQSALIFNGTLMAHSYCLSMVIMV